MATLKRRCQVASSCAIKILHSPSLKRNKKIVGGRLTLYIRYVKKNYENQNTSPPENCVISLEILVLKLFVGTQKKI